jgi:hypothetical protein
MSVSHDKQSAAASALQVTTAGACSQTSHIHTRSWREASLLAPCTLPSQPRQRYAASALQYTTALESWHASQRFGILQKNQFFSSPPKAPLRPDLASTYCSTLPPLPPFPALASPPNPRARRLLLIKMQERQTFNVKKKAPPWKKTSGRETKETPRCDLQRCGCNKPIWSQTQARI